MREEHLSHFQFDLALVDAVPSEAQVHLKDCAGCQTELQRLQAEQQQFADSPAPVQAARRIHARLAPASTWRSQFRLWWLMLPAAATAALLLSVHPSSDEVRSKGAPSLELFVKRGKSATRWRGEPLSEGDSVQLGVQSQTGRTVTVFSVAPDCSAKLEWQGRAPSDGLLPLSWQLTGKVREERLYVAFSDGGVALDDFSAALKSAHCSARVTPLLEADRFFATGLSLVGK